jgi:disulfide bond formation protein DsbB
VIAAALFALLARGKGPAVSFRQRLVLWGLGVVFVTNALAYFTALETVPASTVALHLYLLVIVTLLSGLGHDRLTSWAQPPHRVAAARSPPPAMAVGIGASTPSSPPSSTTPRR